VSGRSPGTAYRSPPASTSTTACGSTSTSWARRSAPRATTRPWTSSTPTRGRRGPRASSTRPTPPGVVHDVYVKGFDAASSGWFGDGTGVRGKRVGLEDDTITTADEARTRAYGYFARQFALARGEFNLTDWTPTSGVRAGSLVNITDTATGATGTYRIYGIEKRFHGSGRQDWAVSYGAFRPSLARTTQFTQFVR
jgi:hypothetical protein